jgi:hypothetical protein
LSGVPDATALALQEHSGLQHPSKENPVHASTAYVIYEATARDNVKLWYLSQLTGQPRLRDRVLIGDIQGVPAAAIAIADDRVVADHRRDTARLTQLLRSRAQDLRARERTPSPPVRGIRSAVRVRVLARLGTAVSLSRP